MSGLADVVYIELLWRVSYHESGFDFRLAGRPHGLAAVPRDSPRARLRRHFYRHFIVRLEIAVTSRKQTPAHRSNRNISDPPAPLAAFFLNRFRPFALTSNRSTSEFKKRTSHGNQGHEIF